MKKIISAVLILALMLTVCGCTVVDTKAAPEETPEEAPAQIASVGNPMEDATPESLLADMGLDLSALSSYENVKFFRINGNPVLAHVTFDYEGESYTYRVATPPAECDISGMYFDWVTQEAVKVGYCEATAYTSADGHGYIGWYDAAPGVLYCVSMDKNASTDKLSSIANLLFVPTQGDAVGDFDAMYTAILDEMRAAYFPGTAGSSISGAVCAAKLADLFTSMNPPVIDITSGTGYYCSNLPVEERATFFRQLSGVKSSFISLCESGTGVLSDGGYQPVNEWDQAALEPMFDYAVSSISSAPYAAILEQYYTVVQQDWSMEALIENNLNMMLGYVNSLDEIGYQIADLDGDGMYELMIGAIVGDDEFLGNLVYDLFTVNEFGDAVNVFSSQERSRYYYAGGSSFSYHGSGSAFDSVDTTERFADGSMTQIDTQAAPTVTPELTAFSALH